MHSQENLSPWKIYQIKIKELLIFTVAAVPWCRQFTRSGQERREIPLFFATTWITSISTCNIIIIRFIPFYFLKFSTTRPHLTRTFYSIIYYVMMNEGAICVSSGSCGNDTLESSSSRNNLNLGAQQFLNKDSFCVFFAHTMIHSNPVDEQCYYDYKEKMASSFVL
jgi:hypothetical protein